MKLHLVPRKKRGPKINLVGIKFARLLVLSLYKNINGKIYWTCLCDCGKIASVQTAYLNNGHTKSCGCLHYETNCINALTHGDSRLKEYGVWKSMRQRCFNHRHRSYEDYGGRGIRVCERWDSNFSNFFKDMGPCPPNRSLDRINNDGNYEPQNCRWATRKEQLNNTRRNLILSQEEKLNIVRAIKLESISKREASRRFGISRYTINNILYDQRNIQL